MTPPTDRLIKAAETTDIARLADLEIACFSQPWNAIQLTMHFTSGGEGTLLSVGDGPCVAYALWHVIGTEAELQRIGTRTEHRGAGHARALLTQMLEQLAARNICRVFLEVRAGNTQAKALYRRMSFEPCGLRRGYYADTGEDAELYVWTPPPQKSL